MAGSADDALDAPVLRRARPLLGTFVEIGVVIRPGAFRDNFHPSGRAGTCRNVTSLTPADGGAPIARRDSTDEAASRAIDAGFAAIERVARAMSAHDPASDLRRLAAAPVGEPIACDPWTCRLLRLADRLRHDSAGLFDIALGSAGGAAGYRIAADGRIASTHAGLRLDAGGIAKGFAVDVAVATLRANGARDGWVEAGGDLRVFGGCERRILVRDVRSDARGEAIPTAHAPALAAIGSLRQGAVATSQYLESGLSAGKGDALYRPPLGGGRPSGTGLQPGFAVGAGPVTVIAPSCAIADALTKPLALAGEAAADLLARHGATGCLPMPDGRRVFIPPPAG